MSPVPEGIGSPVRHPGVPVSVWWTRHDDSVVTHACRIFLHPIIVRLQGIMWTLEPFVRRLTPSSAYRTKAEKSDVPLEGLNAAVSTMAQQ